MVVYHILKLSIFLESSRFFCSAGVEYVFFGYPLFLDVPVHKNREWSCVNVTSRACVILSSHDWKHAGRKPDETNDMWCPLKMNFWILPLKLCSCRWFAIEVGNWYSFYPVVNRVSCLQLWVSIFPIFHVEPVGAGIEFLNHMIDFPIWLVIHIYHDICWWYITLWLFNVATEKINFIGNISRYIIIVCHDLSLFITSVFHKSSLYIYT